jgi:hypothetical protein
MLRQRHSLRRASWHIHHLHAWHLSLHQQLLLLLLHVLVLAAGG